MHAEQTRPLIAERFHTCSTNPLCVWCQVIHWGREAGLTDVELEHLANRTLADYTLNLLLLADQRNN